MVFDGTLKQGFVLGVDSQFGDRAWVEQVGRAMKMSYPGEQGWGAVYVSVGSPYPDSQRSRRRSIDLSRYSMLSVELKGEKGGEVISVGIKDKNDPNNGSEIKKSVTVSSNWRTYNFILADFKTADLDSVHIPIEIIFGREKYTVYFRNIRIFK